MLTFLVHSSQSPDSILHFDRLDCQFVKTGILLRTTAVKQLILSRNLGQLVIRLVVFHLADCILSAKI